MQRLLRGVEGGGDDAQQQGGGVYAGEEAAGAEPFEMEGAQPLPRRSPVGPPRPRGFAAAVSPMSRGDAGRDPFGSGPRKWVRGS